MGFQMYAGRTSKIKDEERELIDLCRSPGFWLRELAERIQAMNIGCDLPWRGSK